jgi:hypothetical protein
VLRTNVIAHAMKQPHYPEVSGQFDFLSHHRYFDLATELLAQATNAPLYGLV